MNPFGSNTFKGHYPIDISDTDLSGKISFPNLVRYMQEAAMQHVVQLKISAFDLKKLGLTWVLYKMNFNIQEFPEAGEILIIQTHPTGFKKIYTYRDYWVKTKTGKEILTATSTWLMMDIKSRKMATIPNSISSLPLSEERKPLPRIKNRIPVLTNAFASNTFNVGYYHLDFNGHLNNIYYPQWMQESLALSFHQEHQLIGFNLEFRAEAKYGLQVKSEVEQLEENVFLHKLSDSNSNQILALGESRWIPRNNLMIGD